MAEKLLIVIDATDNASGVLRGVAGTAKGEFAGIGGTVKAHAGEIRAAGMATTAFGVATLAVAKGNLDAYRNQEVSQAKLTAAIKGSAQAIDQSRLEKLADELQDVTTFGDEATETMMAMLTTFDLTEDQIVQLAPRIQNISAMMGTDLQSSAVAVGKAISTANWGALTRFGIIIDEDTQKSGDFVKILQAIDRNTGPAAEELAKGAGAAEQLANQFGDLREVAGEALVPALVATVAVLKPTVEIAKAFVSTPLGKAFVIAATGAGLLAVPLGAMIALLPSAVAGWELLTGAQIRNAVAARGAAAANAQAGAAAAAGGAAAGGGGLLGGMKGFAAGTAVGRTGLYGLAALGLYAGTTYGLQKWEERSEAKAEDIEKGRTETPEQKALIASNMARWQKAREAQGIAAAPTAGFPEAIPELAAIPTEQMISDQMLAPELAASIASPVGQMPDLPMAALGGGAFALPATPEPAYATALRRQKTPPQRALTVNAEGVEVSESYTDRGREVLIRVLIPETAAGILTDATTDWMEDLAYQGVG